MGEGSKTAIQEQNTTHWWRAKSRKVEPTCHQRHDHGLRVASQDFHGERSGRPQWRRRYIPSTINFGIIPSTTIPFTTP
jgi:hypothetical protein